MDRVDEIAFALEEPATALGTKQAALLAIKERRQELIRQHNRQRSDIEQELENAIVEVEKARETLRATIRVLLTEPPK